MTTALGKRKRPEPEGVKASVAVPEAEIDVQAIFQRHFEARFRPLKTASQALGTPARGIEGQGEASSEESGSESSSESGWGGISDDEEKEDAVEIIDHSAQAPAPSLSTMTKHELKAFMVGRVFLPCCESTATTAEFLFVTGQQQLTASNHRPVLPTTTTLRLDLDYCRHAGRRKR